MSHDMASLSPSSLMGRLARFHRLMEELGIEWQDYQNIIDDQKRREDLANYWLSGGFSIDAAFGHDNARKIMGRNYFGLEHVLCYFGFFIRKEWYETFAHLPFTPVMLHECKKTHVLVADVGLSIRELQEHFPNHFVLKERWYQRASFAQKRSEPQWRLIAKKPIKHSASKTWKEQKALIAESEEVPSAREMIYAITGQYLSQGESLFEYIRVRTADVVSRNRILVGGYGKDHDLITYCSGGPSPYIGLATSRKPIS